MALFQQHAQAVLIQVWHLMLDSSWILPGLTTFLFVYLMGRLALYGYREHSYLYQFGDRAVALENWINLLLPLVRRIGMPRYRALVTRDLNRSAINRRWESSHFMAKQLLDGLLYLAFGVLGTVIFDVSLVWALVPAGYGFITPLMRLNAIATKRFVSCRRDLPFIIDYVSLAMGAGLDFNKALDTVIKDAPRTPLSIEFEIVLRNIRIGMSLAEALIEMERRLDSPQLRLFVQTMVQAMEMGTDVVRTLTVMSETLQEKRFQMAEELAGKISVRMMLPLMVFVLPVVMIILLGPMMLSSPLMQ